MIVRERKNEFVLIEQDHHAQISGIIMSYWKDSLFSAPEFRRSVEYAIFQHDCGWKPFDTDPFWNDKKRPRIRSLIFQCCQNLYFTNKELMRWKKRSLRCSLMQHALFGFS